MAARVIRGSRGRHADRRRLGEHEPRARSSWPRRPAPSTATPRCTTPRSAGASSTRRCATLMATTRCRATAENVAQEFQMSARRSGRVRGAQPGQGGRGAGERPLRRRDRRRSTIPQRKGDPVVVDRDEHPRETSVEALAKLKPIVRPDGTVTAGNASGVNDGAAALIVATEEAAKRNGLTPRARFLGAAVAGVPPRIMGIGPAPASREAAQAPRPDDRRHGRDRTERSLRRPGPRRDAPARPRRRRRRT